MRSGLRNRSAIERCGGTPGIPAHPAIGDAMMFRHSNALFARRSVRTLRLLATATAITCATVTSAGAQTTHNCLSPSLPDSTAPTVAREAISILTEPTWSGTRARYAIPLGSASEVSIVQDNAVCNAVMSAFESFTGNRYAEAFVIVRIGTSSPFYLMTRRREGALGNTYLLNALYAVIGVIGSDG